jgi:alpha-methylacyl-CoA racemase
MVNPENLLNNQLLNGVTIIDFSNYLPGPYASLRLAELGATIIKVEPLEGDPARNTGLEKDGTGVVFLANNRYKKSVTLNLKTSIGRELALKLISKADVVLESFRPGVMRKLGLDYENAFKHNPAIIYCSISGYGEQGEISRLGSHDLNYMGLSGVLAQMKDSEGKPIHPSITFADYIGGMAASERILAALVSKGISGKGSNHCISLTDVMVSLMGTHVLIEKEKGFPYGVSILNGEIISYAIYETKDERFVTLGALEPKFWRNLCEAVNRLDWIPSHFSKTDKSLLKRKKLQLQQEFQLFG